MHANAAHASDSSARAERPGLAVLIPAHDEEFVIEACLTSLLGQDFRGHLQVVVVANGCSDREDAPL